MKERCRHEEEVAVAAQTRSLFSAKEDRSSERASKVCSEKKRPLFFSFLYC